MAEKRQPQYRIAITGPGRFRRVSELYPATLFPGGEGLPDRYRVRVDRVWHMPGGLKYAYLPLDEALAVAGFGRSQGEARPDLTPHCQVRVPNGQVTPEGVTLYDVTWTATAPFQGPDGRWRIFVLGRREPVLVNTLQRKR